MDIKDKTQELNLEVEAVEQEAKIRLTKLSHEDYISGFKDYVNNHFHIFAVQYLSTHNMYSNLHANMVKLKDEIEALKASVEFLFEDLNDRKVN